MSSTTSRCPVICSNFEWISPHRYWQQRHTNFYRAAWNGMEQFCLSVRLSVKRVHCDKTEKSVQNFIPCERSFSLAFWEEEWLMGAIPSTWNFGSTGPRWSEIADFEPIIARSASAVRPSEKVQLALMGSLPYAFQWVKDEHRALSLSPPKGGSKTQSVQNLNNKLR